jgi:hydroxymethylglutaryl-CoA reductase
MLQRGGGVVGIRSKLLAPDMMVVELLVDVKDAMGANVVNTICEGVSQFVQSVIGQG